ncbi:MAG TPA: nitrogenase component 1, partial [Polyangiaceae bacterium]|nr:nitrogenase component 1 [Polyangiaceae bacterium]
MSIPPLPNTKTHVLGGKVVAAGGQARQAIAALFGFDPSEATAVAWVDHAVEIAIDANGNVQVLRVERRESGSRGLVRTAHLNIYARGKDLPQSFAERVRRAAERLSGWTVDHLAVLVASNPESGSPGLAMPPARDEAKRPRSLLDTWGAADSFADFFAGGEIARSQLDSIDPSKLFHFVQHCDAECLFVNPHSVGFIVTLVNFPWDDRVREPGHPGGQNLANITDRDFVEEGMVTTDLTEDDVIMGNPGKLTSLIEYAVSRPSSGDKLLFVSNTCVPTVIGEDVESVVKRVRNRTGKEILYLTVTPRSMTNVFQSLLVDRRLEAEAKAVEADERSVNLIGFAGAKAVEELREALREFGVGVNVVLLPDLNVDRVDALPRARTNVFYPNQLWRHMYDQVLDRSSLKAVEVPGPFGFEASRAWFRQVAQAVGESDEAKQERAWEKVVAPWQSRWENLCAQARSYRLGFVVRDEEAYYLTNPGASWGVPLLELVEEMGFGIDVLVGVSDAKIAKNAALAIRRRFRKPDRHSVRAFDSFSFLRKRLRDCPANAFLSYHFY